MFHASFTFLNVISKGPVDSSFFAQLLINEIIKNYAELVRLVRTDMCWSSYPSSIPAINYLSLMGDLKNILHNSILVGWTETLSNFIKSIKLGRKLSLS